MQNGWIMTNAAAVSAGRASFPAAAVLAHESREESRRAGAYAWAIVAVWMVSTAYAFWAFEFKQQRSFESPHSVLFDSAARASSAEAWYRESVAPQIGAGVATVVHVYSAGCACNRFTHPHLARIVSAYRRQGVNFVAALRTDAASSAYLPEGPAGLAQVALPARGALSWIEATPAALVFDARGRLIYFGPYSDSARCGESGGLVERVLDSVLRGRATTPQPFYGGGCFCGADRAT